MNCVFDILIDFKKSSGSYIFDKKSNKFFLDFFSMFSSLPLGYNHQVFDESFYHKICNISHLRMCNNLFLSEEFIDFENEFKKISFHPNLHFCETGSLAVESAIKCAFEYSKYKQLNVVSLKNSFHGINSWGFVTDSKMSSVVNRVKYFPKNSWKNIPVDKILTYIKMNKDNLSAVVLEPIQCTAGDIYLDISILKQIEFLCKKNNICLIIDEIQTGFGTTGNIWYSKKIGIKPDIIIFGKKSQINGIMVNNKYSEAINSKNRKLHVTFDGDLIDAIRSQYILKAIDKHSLLKKVKKNSKILKTELFNKFENYRTAGYLIAFDFKDKITRDNFLIKAYSKHMLLHSAGEKTIRIRPNLALSDNEIDEFLLRINKILK